MTKIIIAKHDGEANESTHYAYDYAEINRVPAGFLRLENVWVKKKTSVFLRHRLRRHDGDQEILPCHIKKNWVYIGYEHADIHYKSFVAKFLTMPLGDVKCLLELETVPAWTAHTQTEAQTQESATPLPAELVNCHRLFVVKELKRIWGGWFLGKESKKKGIKTYLEYLHKLKFDFGCTDFEIIKSATEGE